MNRLALGLFAGLAVATSALASPSTAQLDALMAQSGLNDQLAAVPELVSQGIERGLQQGTQALPVRHVEALLEQVRRDYDAEAMRITVHDALQTLDSDDIELNLAWLKSAHGQLLTQAEIKAGTPEGVSATHEFITNIRTQAPDDNRMARIRLLDTALRATEHTLSMQRNTVLSMLVAANAAAPEEMRQDYAALSAFTDQIMAAGAAQQITVHTQLAMFHTYRNVPDDTIDAYITHLETPSGRAYTDALHTGLEQAMFNASTKFGHSMATLIKIIASESTS